MSGFLGLEARNYAAGNSTKLFCCAKSKARYSASHDHPMKLQIQKSNIIEASDWDAFVSATYQRPYHVQQQDGCSDRGIRRFKVPDQDNNDDMHDSVPEICNHDDKGVKFEAWLKRDPKQHLCADEECSEEQWVIDLWWDRNFYPDFQKVANDLHAKGLLPAGNYILNIDW